MAAATHVQNDAVASASEAAEEQSPLQMWVRSQQQWDKMLTTKGVLVVEVYQRWCGPGCVVQDVLRKIKKELHDDMLFFAAAEADSVDTLKMYIGKCEPIFIIYRNGRMVIKVRGVNPPLLLKLLKQELAMEHKLHRGAGDGK